MPYTKTGSPAPVRSRHHRRPIHPVRRLILLCLLLLAAFVVGSVLYVLTGVSKQAAVKTGKPREFTASERARLTVLYQRCRPDRLAPEDTRSVRLNEGDVNLLLALFIDGADRNAKQRVTFGDGWFQVRMSVPCHGLLRGRWWNISFAVRPSVAEREVALDVRGFLFGDRPLPDFAARWWVEREVRRDINEGRFDAFFNRVSSMLIDGGHVLTRCRHFELPTALLSRFLPPTELGTGVPPEETSRLLGILAGHGWEADPSEAVVFLFRAVGDAVKAGKTPGRENGAALAVLALTSGNLDLEDKIKITLGADLRERIRRHPMIVVLSDRKDVWPLLLRATVLTLTQGADAAFSKALEREMRAALTPKGLSYVHLLAALAGSALAETASSSPQQARTLQERLSSRVSGYAFFPPDLRDLRESIALSDFESRYGGVHGPLHLRIVEDMREMIQGCPAYR